MRYATKEVDAKEKWCPFARVSSVDGRGSKDDPGRLFAPGQPAYNRQWVQDFDSQQALQPGGSPTRHNLIPSTCRCLGSACMAWRWMHDPDEAGAEHVEEHGGYCGLAGYPFPHQD